MGIRYRSMDTSIPLRNHTPASLRQKRASRASIAKSEGVNDDNFRIRKGRAKSKAKETAEKLFQRKSRESILGSQELSHEEMQNTRNLRVQGLRPSASEAAREQLGDEEHSAEYQQQSGMLIQRNHQRQQQQQQQQQESILGGQERSHEEMQDTRNLRVDEFFWRRIEKARDERRAQEFRHIKKSVLQSLEQETGPLSGWQAGVQIQERTLIAQM